MDVDHANHRAPSIPYPGELGLNLSGLPLILYRMGLGPLLGGKVMILTTRGRRTGLWRHTPLAYLRDGDTLYAISNWGERADWYRNLQSSPDATVQIGNWRYAVKGAFVTEPEGLRAFVALLRRVSPAGEQFISATQGINLDNDADLARLRVVRFTPSGFPPQGEVPTDLLWVWAIALPAILALARQVLKRRKLTFAVIAQAAPFVMWVVRQYLSQPHRTPGAGWGS